MRSEWDKFVLKHRNQQYEDSLRKQRTLQEEQAILYPLHKQTQSENNKSTEKK